MSQHDEVGTTTDQGWAHFTPHLPEVIDDPYPAFRWLRRHAPAFHVESEDIWVLSRHADVQAAARDFATFSQLEGVGYSRNYGGLGLTSLDPPHHTEMRRLTAPLFSPRAVKQHRAQAVAVLDRLLDEVFATSTPVNVADVVANPYLSTIVGDLMGLPEPDRGLVKDGATAGSLMMAGDFDPEVVAMAQRFSAYFVGFVRQRGEALDRGECPAGPFSNIIFETCPSGYEPTFDERVTYETLLATGGNETTAQLLSNLVILLAEQPEILERLRAEPQLRPSAVEEVLRYISPVTGLFRHTTRAVPIAGAHREIPAGAKVLLMYGSANHDEAHYDRADEFVIDRYPRGFADADHLSFTIGIHVCLGAHLAREMIDVFLERFAARVGRITITGPVQRSHNALVRVIDELPARLEPRASVV